MMERIVLMAALTEKDLEDKRAKNTKLRESIADAQVKAAAAVQEQNMAISGAALDAETARLEATLAAAKEAAKVSVVREGASSVLASVTQQLEAAQAGGTPLGVVVDTNESAPVETDKNGGNS